MPLETAENVAKYLADKFYSGKKPVMTISLSDDFKAISGRQRLKDSFLEDVISELKNSDLIVGHEKYVIVISEDKNFSPNKEITENILRDL